MKVLFTFGGLPHYYNLVLNKLNRIPNLEVVVIVPSLANATLGAGVYQKKEGIEFKVIELEEYKTVFGKVFFKGFTEVIKKEKPDILVTVWPYVLNIVFDPWINRTIKKLNIKLIYKDIPFNIPKYQEAQQYLKEQKVLSETMSKKKTTLVDKIKFGIITEMRRIYFRAMDAHVDYTEDAFDIFESYGVDKTKIFITYNSPDTDTLLAVRDKILKESPILPINSHRLIHVGRLVKWKRVDLLIEAFAQIKKSYEDAELLIIGTGPEERNLKNLVEKLQLSSSVSFLGGIYDTELLGKYLLASSVYVLAGMGGLSINEAMCFGKPIICSMADGTEKHLVKDEYNGKYFSNGDRTDLYEKIKYLLSDPERTKKMGSNSLHIIQNEININTVIKGYVNAFNYVTVGKEKLTYTY